MAFQAQTNRNTELLIAGEPSITIPVPDKTVITVELEDEGGTIGAVSVTLNGQKMRGTMNKAHYDRLDTLPRASVLAPVTGSVSGNVFSTTTVTGGASTSTVASGAKVTVVGEPMLTAQTDSKGFYVINGIAPGDCVIEAQSADVKKKGTSNVTVQPGRTVGCHIEIA